MRTLNIIAAVACVVGIAAAVAAKDWWALCWLAPALLSACAGAANA